jgi:integrase
MGILFKRGETFYAQYFDANGKRHQTSTRTRDRKSAEALLREFERRAADPAYAASNETTLEGALTQLLRSRKSKGRSEETVNFYRSKSGHLTRLLGASLALAKLNARLVDDYVITRQDEGASNNTISKELTTLRGALKVAKRRGEFTGDIAAIMPDGFSAQYQPKERFLTAGEAQNLLAELTPDRAARVAFILATSARLGESDRAMLSDVDLNHGLVRVRGTKTERSARMVPIVGAGHDLIQHCLRYAEGEGGLLFRPWGNIRRDLHEACARAGIDPVSPNDLRRTTATWMVMGGVSLHLISKVLGHRDTRMVERVYGQMPPEALKLALKQHLEGPDDCSLYAARSGADDESDGHHGQPSGDPQNEKTLKTKGFQGFDCGFSSWHCVPRDGIEPPTRGFSIPCSTY